MQNARSIALIGLSGVGKSSVGRALAARVGWALTDTDALIVSAASRSVAAIFAADGEARFRDLEERALERALAGGPAVVATGGGAVLREANRALLRARAWCVWLDAPTAALVARLHAHSERRPLVGSADPAERLEALRRDRAPLYAALADLRVATDAHTPSEIAVQIEAAFVDRQAGGMR